MSAGGIGAIILAAGSSSRLGESKQFLRYAGETLIRRAAQAALQAGCAPVVVVAGADRARIGQELDGLAVQVQYHNQWQRGMGSSVRAGVQGILRLAPMLEALVLMVCDQPFVDAGVLTALITARAHTRRPIAASAYAGTVGVPALFDCAFFPRLAALGDQEGARELLGALADQVTPVPFPRGDVDIDTPADVSEYITGAPAVGQIRDLAEWEMTLGGGAARDLAGQPPPDHGAGLPADPAADV